MPQPRQVKLRNLLVFACVAACGFGLDWTTKALAHAQLPASDIIVNDRSVSLLFLLPLFAVALALIRIVDSRLISVAMGLVTAGWLGNCLDRNLRGPVTDFIPLPGSGPHQAYCNVADLMLFASLPLMAIALFIWMRRRWMVSRPAVEDLASPTARLLFFSCIAGSACGIAWAANSIFVRLLAPDEIVRDAHRPIRILLAGAVVVLPFAWSAWRSRWGVVGLGLLVGGALANAAERLVYGSVVRFIHLPRTGSTAVVMNLADAAILGGAILLLQAAILEVWGRRPRKLRAD